MMILRFAVLHNEAQRNDIPAPAETVPDHPESEQTPPAIA